MLQISKSCHGLHLLKFKNIFSFILLKVVFVFVFLIYYNVKKMLFFSLE